MCYGVAVWLAIAYVILLNSQAGFVVSQLPQYGQNQCIEVGEALAAELRKRNDIVDFSMSCIFIPQGEDI